MPCRWKHYIVPKHWYLCSVHRIRYFCVSFVGAAADGVSGALPRHLGHMWGHIPDR